MQIYFLPEEREEILYLFGVRYKIPQYNKGDSKADMEFIIEEYMDIAKIAPIAIKLLTSQKTKIDPGFLVELDKEEIDFLLFELTREYNFIDATVYYNRIQSENREKQKDKQDELKILQDVIGYLNDPEIDRPRLHN